MTTHTTPQTGLSAKAIIAPVSDDIARIDDILRSVTTLEHPILRQAVEAIIAAGGKRLRPAILFLVAKFHRYDLDRLLPLAAAIELLHTASLIHDDTIDQALTRRGLPTLNSMIDPGTTVLVGDYLFAKSAVLSTMGGVQRATRIFAESLVTISEGEIEQKFATHHLDISIEQYFSRIYAKTAVLFAAAGEIGAVLSDAPEDDVQRLRHYGRQIGMAFQIVDDILDVRATSEELGKPAGSDLLHGNVTLPTILYLERAGAEEREAVRRVVERADGREDLAEATIERIVASDAPERGHAIAQRFVDEAKASLAGFQDIPARKLLADLADFVVQRRF
ncbi:MAG TPA: polyprenyl synthetase family protein [Chloroflexia bacterium]|nr:polyprenyl synthetase family protein [Chloroflexia bacterium]